MKIRNPNESLVMNLKIVRLAGFQFRVMVMGKWWRIFFLCRMITGFERRNCHLQFQV